MREREREMQTNRRTVRQSNTELEKRDKKEIELSFNIERRHNNGLVRAQNVSVGPTDTVDYRNKKICC